MSLARVFGYNQDELCSNRDGRLAESQAERLAELVVEARRMILPRAMVIGCSVAAFIGAVPSIVFVAVAGLPAGAVVAAGGVMAALVSALSLGKQKGDIAKLSQALSTRRVQVAEGSIGIQPFLAIPAMKRGYHLRLAHPEVPRHPPQWSITREQGAALVRDSRYRIYHTASVIQSIEPLSELDAGDRGELLERPPIRWKA